MALFWAALHRWLFFEPPNLALTVHVWLTLSVKCRVSHRDRCCWMTTGWYALLSWTGGSSGRGSADKQEGKWASAAVLIIYLPTFKNHYFHGYLHIYVQSTTIHMLLCKLLNNNNSIRFNRMNMINKNYKNIYICSIIIFKVLTGSKPL